jgi:hypothetical protein
MIPAMPHIFTLASRVQCNWSLAFCFLGIFASREKINGFLMFLKSFKLALFTFAIAAQRRPKKMIWMAINAVERWISLPVNS